jgi:hypothetical protein
MLRQACGAALLRDFRQRLDELFAKCAALSEAEFTRLFHDGDATEQGLWEQAKRGHLYDRTFKAYADRSYFDAMTSSGIWIDLPGVV